LNEQLSDDGYWSDRDKPTYVHWLNYYDKATAERIGLKKLLNLESCEPLGEGYFIKLQDMPIDINNPDHLSLQRQVSKQLGLIGSKR